MEPFRSVPAQRAGDADRDAAAETVRSAGADGRLTVEELEQRLAAVFAAKTHPELDALLADLWGRQGLAARFSPSPLIPSGTPQPPGPETQRTLTFMSDTARRGFWRPAANGRVITVMGDATIDLTEADLSRPVTYLRVLTVMGSTKIEVPDDISVHVSKLAIMADNDVQTPDEPTAPGAPEVHIRLVSIIGEAKVRCSRRHRPRLDGLYA